VQRHAILAIMTASPSLRLPAKSPTYGLDVLTIRILVAVDIAVAGLCPWLQGLAARSSGFDSTTMILAEAGCYVLGGIAVAGSTLGPPGIRRCCNLRRYAMFLPASLAYSFCNFLTYPAVKGLGASCFTLMVQLRIVLFALLSHFWHGSKKSMTQWLSLIQLSIGMVVVAVLRQDYAEDVELPAAEMEGFRTAILALGGVIFLSAFGVFYLEGALKATAEDPVYIQVHQFNFFGCCCAMFAFLGKNVNSEVHDVSKQVLVAAANSTENSIAFLSVTAPAAAVGSLSRRLDALLVADQPPVPVEGAGFSPFILVLWAITVLRGVLSSVILKNLDSVSKGLIDVTSIILCTTLEIVFEGRVIDPKMTCLQAMILLSIISYMTRHEPGKGTASSVDTHRDKDDKTKQDDMSKLP